MHIVVSILVLFATQKMIEQFLFGMFWFLSTEISLSMEISQIFKIARHLVIKESLNVCIVYSFLYFALCNILLTKYMHISDQEFIYLRLGILNRLAFLNRIIDDL